MRKSIDLARSIVNNKTQEDLLPCDEFVPFLVQRYISTVSPLHCNLINDILNTKMKNWTNSQEIFHYLKCIIPKKNVYNFNYIWKSFPKETYEIPIESICENLEMSRKEFTDILDIFPEIGETFKESKERILKKQ